jgi:phage terminase large subunit-like protein
VRQGIALMGAIKTIEIKLADYSFRHGGSEMLAWCVGNLRVVPTPTAMMVARDEAASARSTR